MPQRLRNGPYSCASDRTQSGRPPASTQTRSPVPNRAKRRLPSVAGVGTAMPPGANWPSDAADPKKRACLFC